MLFSEVAGLTPYAGNLALAHRSVSAGGPRGHILCVPGGPGLGGDSLSPFEGLAVDGWTVSFFDPIDTAGSARSPSPSYHTLDHHVGEIDAIRSALQLPRVVLLGHSYGGLLALQYTLEYPGRVSALILVSGFASIPLLYGEKRRLADSLPPRWQRSYVDRMRRSYTRLKPTEEQSSSGPAATTIA